MIDINRIISFTRKFILNSYKKPIQQIKKRIYLEKIYSFLTQEDIFQLKSEEEYKNIFGAEYINTRVYDSRTDIIMKKLHWLNYDNNLSLEQNNHPMWTLHVYFDSEKNVKTIGFKFLDPTWNSGLYIDEVKKFYKHKFKDTSWKMNRSFGDNALIARTHPLGNKVFEAEIINKKMDKVFVLMVDSYHNGMIFDIIIGTKKEI